MEEAQGNKGPHRDGDPLKVRGLQKDSQEADKNGKNFSYLFVCTDSREESKASEFSLRNSGGISRIMISAMSLMTG